MSVVATDPEQGDADEVMPASRFDGSSPYFLGAPLAIETGSN